MAFVEALFWLSIFLIIYALIGYPLLALLLGAVSGRKVQKQAITPPITLIIAAYNEESAIAEKIESLELDYPRDQLEILVADDGSTDRTREIVRSYADRGVRLYEGEGRAGKTITLNGAVENATGEIVVFSDATGVFNPQSLRELAANFADPTVGCVSGRVAYSYTEDTTSEGFRVYQGFAVAVRNAEGSFGSLTSVSGAIHALRKSIFRPSEASHTQDLADVIHTVEGEEACANAIRFNNLVLFPANFPVTAARLRNAGYEVREIGNSEAAKLDGGMSCLSLRFSPQN